MIRMRRVIYAVAVGLVLSITFASGARLEAQGGAIRACVANSGAVRIVSPAEACKVGETPLVWNAAGSQGPEGPAGPAGPAGPQGPQGPAGEVPTPTISAQLTLDSGTPSPILNFSLGGTSPTTIGSATGGAGAGKISFLPMNVTKLIDGLSPLLLTRLANGVPFAEVKIEAFGPGNAPLATYTLKETFVVSDIVGGATMSLTEQVSFVFGILESDIYVNGTAVNSCWNQLANKPC